MEYLNLATNILVALIGAGITGILGVNLWTSLSIDKKIKKSITEGLDVLRKENMMLKKDLINHSTASLHFTIARQLNDSKNYDIAFFFYLKGVEAIIKIKELDRTTEMINIYDLCLDNSLVLIKSQANMILESSTIYNMRKIIEDILIDTKDKRSNELYTFLLSVFNKP